MPRHIPIRFEDPGLSEISIQRIRAFIKKHPIAASGMQAMLITTALGGVLTLAVPVPGVFSAWSYYAAQKKRDKQERYRKLWRNFNQLKKENSLIYKGDRNGEAIYELTQKGKKRLQNFFIETLEITSPKRWDGKWRVILFDIPMGKRKSVRNSFRKKLQDLDCFQFQRSVWVHPFPCEVEIEFLKDYYKLGSYVTIWKVSEMPSGRVLYHFKDRLKRHI